MAGGATKASLGSDQVWSAKGGIREADLAKIWAGQSFAPLALRLSDGRSPRVILPGRPGGGAGPDFRDAVIAFDGEERRGDVELHLHASSFRVHGHDKDPAYNRVVLHVVVWADDEADTRLSNGAWAPVAGFESWLAMRSEEMSDWLENATIWREPCTRAAQGLGEEGIDAVLSAEGEARFALKKGRLLDSISELGEEAAFWQAFLDGLGYGGDRSAWRPLGLVLPADRLRSLAAADAVEPILMAVAGLATPRQGDGVGPAINPVMRPGSRPANDPRRRLAALARLWQRADADLPAFALASAAEAASVSELVSRWQVMDTEHEMALHGRQRASELVLNVILPYVAATKPELRQQVESFVHQLRPAPAYGKTAILERNLRRPDGRRRVQTALQQQGLLALDGNWCRRGGCGRCPLS